MAARKRLLDQPPQVIQRWVRIKLVGHARNVARALSRVRLPIAERKRRAALEGAFNAVKKQAIKLEHSNFKASSVIVNLALFLLIAERDVFSLKVYALTHRDEWTRKLCARIILLTIHELDLDKVSGRELKDAMRAIGASEDMQYQVASALREVRRVQSSARKEFATLRNTAIAHRDPDSLLQYRAIRNVNVEEIFAIAAAFYLAVGKIVELVSRLLEDCSSIEGLFRQYVQYESDQSTDR